MRRGFAKTLPDPGDRHRLSISLSDAGCEAFARHRPSAFAVTDETLAPLDPAERRTLLDLLEKLR